ncbi:MAG: hypothetical protein GY745_15595 [Actinomycetia bacterium]|nr:hypothetical protein [Actinomycetes bacterium]
MPKDQPASIHPRQFELTEPMKTLWRAALADAGILPGEALVYPFPGTQSSTEQFSAVTWLPGRVDGIQDPEVDAIVGELNHSESVRTTRVAVWIDRSEPDVAGLTRHELQHALQFAAERRLARLHEIAEDVVRLAADSAERYQLIPTEMDANRAASQFVRSYFPDVGVDEMIGDQDSALRRDPGPEIPLETLPEQMILFLVDNGGLCEQWAGTKADMRRRLNSAWPGAGDIWEAALKGESPT